jgi:hypothetical protein
MNNTYERHLDYNIIQSQNAINLNNNINVGHDITPLNLDNLDGTATKRASVI